MSKKEGFKYEHEGWSIEFSQGHKRFEIVPPNGEQSGRSWFDTAREAETAIENRIKNAAKAKRALLNIQVMNDEGETVRVHGIHAGKGELLSKGNLSYDLFPPVAWVEALLLQRRELLKQAKELTNKVKQVAFRYDTYRYDSNSAESWEGAVEKLQKSIADATKRANEITEEAARLAVEQQNKEKV